MQLLRASELLLHLAIHDHKLNDLAVGVHAAIGRLDENGVYVPESVK